MALGKIIFLNGASCSGKTSIVHALQPLLDEPYWHVPIDAFAAMAATPVPAKFSASYEPMLLLRQFFTGFHASIAALASAGNNLIVETGLLQPEWLMECIEMLSPFDVLFVGVHCSLDELDRRERERGELEIGVAREEHALVHAHGLYDLAVDTSLCTPDECARQIKDTLDEHHAPGYYVPSAFTRIRQLLTSNHSP